VYRLADSARWGLEARGQIEGFGVAPRFRAKDAHNDELVDDYLTEPVSDGRSALNVLTVWLRARYGGGRVLGVGHRVVHGGARFSGPTIVTPEILAELHELIPLAPLHQPYNLAAIETAFERLPGVPQVACFDTSFHRSHPQVADLVPLPKDLCESGLRQYGFHGLSYEYIASVLPGASLCALSEGKSIDNTLGFTALDGLCMGTRPGSLDPGVVLYLFQVLGLSAKEVESILYKKSGLLGISAISSDMRELLGSSEPGARLAVDYFVYRAAKEIGALTAVLGGIDSLVFTAGIGENSAEIRRRICEASSWLGLAIDEKANTSGGPRISTRQSKVSVWVIPTNEELMIARHTGTLLGLR
jgi:acetate kinase